MENLIWKIIRKIRNCKVSHFFTKHFLSNRYEYANERVDDLRLTFPIYFAYDFFFFFFLLFLQHVKARPHIKIHSTKKVSSRQTLFDIAPKKKKKKKKKKNHLNFNACRIFLRTFWVVIHCLCSPLYCEITDFMNRVQEKSCTFVNWPMALQSMTLKYWHNSSVHTMERLVALLNKSATFFQAPCLTKQMFWFWK